MRTKIGKYDYVHTGGTVNVFLVEGDTEYSMARFMLIGTTITVEQNVNNEDYNEMFQNAKNFLIQ